MERLADADHEQQKHGLAQLKQEICGSTASMTSVPKPLKFLNPLYKKIKETYLAQPNSQFKVSTSEINQFS